MFRLKIKISYIELFVNVVLNCVLGIITIVRRCMFDLFENYTLAWCVNALNPLIRGLS